MKRILTYNGIDLSTFGAHVSGEGAWVKPAPEFERISVPGRSGDVLLYNGRYSNVDITYRFGITNDFDENYNGLIAALMGSPGYHKLVDSKHPGVYRMAAVDKGMAPTMTDQQSVGEFEVTFNCKPQTYLDEGDEVASTWYDTTYQTSRIVNPTAFDARPLVVITLVSSSTLEFIFRLEWYKSGSQTATTKSITFTFEKASGTVASPIYYDSESGDVYDANGNSLNEYVTIERYIGNSKYVLDDAIIPGGYSFYAYVSGTAQTSKFSKIEIIPRWWRL